MRRLLAGALLAGAMGCSDGDNGPAGLGNCGSSWDNYGGLNITPERCAEACREVPTTYEMNPCLALYTRADGASGSLQCEYTFTFGSDQGCCISDVIASGSSAFDEYFGECEGSN